MKRQYKFIQNLKLINKIKAQKSIEFIHLAQNTNGFYVDCKKCQIKGKGNASLSLGIR